MMPLLIVSKIACQRIFVLSDSGVPRTFVMDCRSYGKMRDLVKFKYISTKL